MRIHVAKISKKFTQFWISNSSSIGETVNVLAPVFGGSSQMSKNRLLLDPNKMEWLWLFGPLGW